MVFQVGEPVRLTYQSVCLRHLFDIIVAEWYDMVEYARAHPISDFLPHEYAIALSMLGIDRYPSA